MFNRKLHYLLIKQKQNRIFNFVLHDASPFCLQYAKIASSISQGQSARSAVKKKPDNISFLGLTIILGKKLFSIKRKKICFLNLRWRNTGINQFIKRLKLVTLCLFKTDCNRWSLNVNNKLKDVFTVKSMFVLQYRDYVILPKFEDGKHKVNLNNILLL